MTDTPERYRTDQYGSVYEYSAELGCYVYRGGLHGRTLEEFLADTQEIED